MDACIHNYIYSCIIHAVKLRTCNIDTQRWQRRFAFVKVKHLPICVANIFNLCNIATNIISYRSNLSYYSQTVQVIMFS